MTVIEIKRSGNQLCTEPREIRILDSSGNAERSIRSTKRIENCEREAIASIPRFVLRAATAKMMSGSDCAQVLPDKKFRSRSHDAVIRVYDEAGNVVEMQQHAGEFKGGVRSRLCPKTGAKSNNGVTSDAGPAILFKSRRVQFRETYNA